MSIKVYGIKNCNTMKKTFDFLAEKGVEYDFIDYKKQKPDAALLEGFLEKTELASLVNKKGTTYRKMQTLSRNSKTLRLCAVAGDKNILGS